MADEDLYKILGVSRDASQADIQKAYRDLARKYHPDMNPDDERAKEKFQRVQQAYDVLNNPEKREMYDRYGSSFENMGAGRSGPWRGPGGGGPEYQDVDFSQFFSQGEGGSGHFADFFRRFTGGATAERPRRPRRGADLHDEVQIPFQTSVRGGEVQLTVGREGGRHDTISVKIPPGIEDGKKIRIRGQGQSSPSGESGDIILTVRVAPHPCFRRRGRNLEVTVPVTFGEAALGATVDVPTPQGTISLKVPAGSSSGRRLRIKGHGIPAKDGDPGDLFAELQVVLPDRWDEEDQQRIRELEQRHPQQTRSELRW